MVSGSLRPYINARVRSPFQTHVQGLSISENRKSTTAESMSAALVLKSDVGTETFYDSVPNIKESANYTEGRVYR